MVDRGGNAVPKPSGGGGNAVPGGGTGSGWEIPGGNRAAGRGPTVPHKGGGFLGSLHSIGHWIGSKGSLAGHDILQMPGGFYHLAKDTAPLAADIVPGGRGLGHVHHDVQAPERDAKLMGQMTLESLRHPLRDPFQTLLTVAPGLDIAGRLGEAGIAARAADTAAGESRFSEAIKALSRKDVAPRQIHVPGSEEPVYLHAAHNAGVRLIQRAYDRVLQRSLDKESQLADRAQESGRITDKVAAHAMRRAGNAALSASRITTRMREAAPFLLGKAAKQLAKLPLGDGTYKPEDIGDGALALQQENALPREAAVAHRSWAELGLSPKENEAWAKFYDHLDRQGLMRRNPETGKAEINPEASPELHQIGELLRGVGKDYEHQIVESRLMTEEGAAGRRNAPNLVRAGEHIPPTMQRALKLALQHRDNLANAVDSAQRLDEAFQRGEGPGHVNGYPVPKGPRLTPGGVDVPELRAAESPMRDQIVRLQYRLEDAENRVQALAERAAKGSQKPEPYQRAVLRELAKEVHGGDSLAANHELQLVDRIAHQYAIDNNTTLGEFYRQHIPEVIRGLPEEHANVLSQYNWRDAQTALNSMDKSVFRNLGVKPGEIARYVAEGEHGRFWYEESAHAILSMANGDKSLADKIAQLVAIYSPQREPIPNMQLAVNAFNEYLDKGKVESFGTGSQIQKANDLLVHGKDWAGAKTSHFYGNLLEDIDPEKYHREFPEGAVTNDLWMGRLFGLKTDTPTPREYAQMKTAVDKMAEQLGWKPKQVQAALWVGKKADVGGMGPLAGKGMSPEEAAVNFHTALEHEHAVIPFEAAPGADENLMRKYEQLSPKEQRDYTNAKARAVEEYLKESGVFGRLGSKGPGVYEGHVNPGWSTYVAASRGKGLENAFRISESSRAIVDHVTAAIGEALNQEAAAWYKPFFRKAIRESQQNGLALDIGRTITNKEAAALSRELGNDVAIVHDARGARFLNVAEAPNKEFLARVTEIVNRVVGGDGSLRGFAYDGNYIERSDYADHLQRAGTGGRPAVLRGALDRLAERSRAVDRKFLTPQEEEAASEHPVGAAGGRLGGLGEPGRPPSGLEPELLYQHGDFTEPPRSAEEVAHRAFQRAGVDRLGAYERSSGKLYVGNKAQPGTILHEALHATLESLRPELRAKVLEAYGAHDLTPEVHERFAEDMSNRYLHGAELSPELEQVYQSIQHHPGEGEGYVPAYTHDEAGGTAPGPSKTMGTKMGGARSPIRSGEYRGEGLKHGARGLRTLNMISAHLRRINRYLETTALRQSAVKSVGTTERVSSRQILARDLGQEIGKPGSTPKVSADVEQLLGRKVKFQTSPVEQDTETEAGALAGIQAFAQELFPGIEDKNAYEKVGIGTPAPPGYKWVDRGAVPNMSRIFSSSETIKPVKAVDAVNSAITAATVYFKLGHIYTRLFTNAATNLLQGSVTPLGLARTNALWHGLSTLDRWRAYGAVGTNFYEALPAEGDTVAARVARSGARFYGHWVDVPFRFNSLAYQMRQIGVHTPEEFTHALDVIEGKVDVPSDVRAKYIQAAEKADREAIAYDRMNDFEKRFVSRAIWFYPWVKGSTVFTFRTIFEHPFKSAALGALGKLGESQQQQDFPGGVPSYEFGLVQLMGGHNPLVTDPSTFSPFATAGQLLQTPEHPMELAGNLNPVYSGLETLATQRSPSGVPTNSPWLQALAEIVSASPEAQIAEQLGGHNSKMFPTHPAFPADFPGAAAFWRMLFGPAMPRHVDKSQLSKDYGLEKAGPR